jgi:hypothetical protein
MSKTKYVIMREPWGALYIVETTESKFRLEDRPGFCAWFWTLPKAKAWAKENISLRIKELRLQMKNILVVR